MPELTKKAFASLKELIRKHPYSLVFLVAALAWLPVLFIPFINDDYQILGYHSGKGWVSLLRPFYSPDVSGFYWRPLGNLLHPLIMLTVGFHPFAYRLASLILYGSCCVLIARAGESLGLERRYAVSGAILFAVLPSHEYQVAWIADHGESLVTVLLLAAFYFYVKKSNQDSLPVKGAYSFYLLLLLAALVKESAFAGILIPIIALLLDKNLGRRRLLAALRDVIIGAVIISFILAFRWVFIGGTPFSSDHFAHSGALRWLLNFFIYIPLGFFSPEALEVTLSLPKILLALLFIAIAIITWLIFLYRRPVLLSKAALRKLSASLAWFIVFILPGLPTLMRWYVFTASVGLIWALVALSECIKKGSPAKRLSFIIILLLVLYSSVYDFSLMLRWGGVGRRMNEALSGLSEAASGIKTDTLYVWATPDKLDRIPMMKLGTQESIQWGLKNKTITVSTPLRSEMSSFQSSIRLVEKTDTSLIFHINNGRFLPYGGTSRAVIKNESFEAFSEGVRIKIKTFLDARNIPQSVAGLYFQKTLRKPQLYFDGRQFLRIDREEKRDIPF
ncbi:MAG: hypothetical protein HF314_18430 [Ignavibacteria bacterium]|jgi:hypothetical protein|nr:hypothetical protein [Ignavibacteria bacterium]MCU7505067.1 hypothetical protein [Ignavibacteria bacterium]MCU7515293.1 hypothetical protein [Ignavibacteria bacterium]